MIYEHDCDTQLPHNIFDEEFGPDTKVLPPSRPNTEPTPISYMIAKVELGIELGNILQATNRVGKQVIYDEILRFDARLRELRQALPVHLKMQKLSGSQDPLTLIVARFNVDILYQKIVCILHRRYVARSRHNPRYAHSRRAAVEAALEMLRHLINLNRESQPDGRLRSIKWYVASIATKEFLLPSMLLLLDLHFDKQAEVAGQRQASQSLYFWTPEQRMEMIHSLETTRDIWEGLSDGSMEAVKAYNIIKIMLEKIQSPAPEGHASAPAGVQVPPVPLRDDLFANMGGPSMEPEQSAAMTLGMMSSGGLTPNTAAALGGGIQSPGGTTYPPLDLSNSSGGEGMGLTPDFSGDLGLNPGSPFSAMFGNLSNGMDLGQNFDWVSESVSHSMKKNLDNPPRNGVLTGPHRTLYRTTRKTRPGEPMGSCSSPVTATRQHRAGLRRAVGTDNHSARREAQKIEGYWLMGWGFEKLLCHSVANLGEMYRRRWAHLGSHLESEAFIRATAVLAALAR